MSRINKCKGDPVEDALIVSGFLLSLRNVNLTTFICIFYYGLVLLGILRYDMLTSVVLHENDAKLYSRVLTVIVKRMYW